MYKYNTLLQFFLGNIFLIISIFLISKIVLKIKLNKNIFIFIPLFIISSLSSKVSLFTYSLIILSLLVITIILLNKISNKDKLVKKCELLEEYIKNSSDLLLKYASTNHKYKNNLITIKSYIKSNKKEALVYVDSLLDDYKPKKRNWLVRLNNIKEDNIRYFIYYKLSKCEDNKLKIFLDVSEMVNSIDYSCFDMSLVSNILDVLGEYFDNAIYASLESNEKELYFSCYLDDNNLVFLIANTYKDKISLDLIEQNGYTTKGKGHGLGLYSIFKNLKDNKKLDYSYDIVDNYFMAKLIVKLDNYK